MQKIKSHPHINSPSDFAYPVQRPHKPVQPTLPRTPRNPHAYHAIAGIAHALHASAGISAAYPRLWGLSRNRKCRGVYKRVGLHKNLTPSGAGRYTCGGLLRRRLRLLFSLLLIRCQYAVCSDVPVYRASRGFAYPADLLLTSRRVASPPAGCPAVLRRGSSAAGAGRRAAAG